MNYKKAKLITGIIVFIAALTIYLLTLEPTNSFWDCSEFITCANKLEVGHAPGAPVFMLLGRVFSLLASKPANIAICINALSAIASALTVMLLFFTIFWFAEKITNAGHPAKESKKQFILLASAFIGAMTYAFTDSFWFSAVEAEVYATSSFFTALVFWAILKYGSATAEKRSYKWIVLIFFILGLSVGIHLLNMLTIPAMALVVYFKNFKPNVKGILLTMVISGIALVVFIFGIIPGVVKLAAFSDRIFVNSLSLPKYSGAITFIVVLALVLIFGFKYYSKKQKVIQQVMVLFFGFWLIGYSSFIVLVIRSAQNPFVDINNVENIYGLVDYLNREQYPSRPLIYGNNYNSPIVDVKKRYTYKYYNGRYVKDELNPTYVYDQRTMTLFPRMASSDAAHIEAYKQWVKIKGRPVQVTNSAGKTETINVPTLKENMQFFIKYQLGYMYARYLMWNFVGKQNDIQGRGDVLQGNWISGIAFIDNIRLGNNDRLPAYYKNLPSRNAYYFLPFLLGLAGMVYQFKRDKYNFGVNAILFFFTGMAIVLYLNEVPITPRERDYVHVGSFYVFAIWIGIGVQWVLMWAAKWKNTFIWPYIIALLLLMAVPVNMLNQNWDDHNRSNRYVANACGKNMLASCEKNAILFTTADNDTYPIWYLQEVENYRPDIRNILLPFLPVDWYAGQLQNNYGEKGEVPISFNGEELLMSKNQYFPVISRIDSFMDASDVVNFVRSDSDKAKVLMMDNSLVHFIPGNKIQLKVNADNVKNSCIYLKNSSIKIPDNIQITLNKKYLEREDVLILDLLAHNDWKRPIYFVYPHLLDNLGLNKYLHREGMVYRLLPVTGQQLAEAIKDKSLYDYHLVMDQYTWGNYEKPGVYLDYTAVQMAQSFRLRQMFIETANELTVAGEPNKAVDILDKAQEILPPNRIPYSWFIPEMIKAYQWAGNGEKANKLLGKVQDEMNQRYAFFTSLGAKGNNCFAYQETTYILQQLANINQAE